MNEGARESHPDWQSIYAAPLIDRASGWLSGRGAPARLLEIGCSGGSRSSCIPRTALRIGVDIDRRALRIAASRFPGDSFVAADACRLPFRDRSTDAIFCYSVMQYVEREQALAEAARVLSRDGRAAFAENSGTYPPTLLIHAVRDLFDRGRAERVHLTCGGLASYSRFFRVERVMKFHMLAPLASLPSALFSLLTGRPLGPPNRLVFHALSRADVMLRGLFPSLEGWLALVLLGDLTAGKEGGPDGVRV